MSDERCDHLGIQISQNDLIDGIFETTRGLGNHGDKDLKKCVINSPYVRTFDIDPTMECIILATEGLWQALSYDVVVEIVTRVTKSLVFFINT
jgi:serine/threonine protein phosphatase PrpC